MILAEKTGLSGSGAGTAIIYAAMFVVALHLYPQNKDVSIEMINCLKGPAPLSARDISLF